MAEEIEVWRAGVTSQYVNREPSPLASVSPGYPHNGSDAKSGGVTISAYLASKGGGTTHVSVWIPKGEYLTLATAMVKSAPPEAELAFLEAMISRRAKNA